MEKPIFIVGIPRSGSTLWLNVFAENPNVCRIAEMHFLTPFREDFRYFIRKYVGDLNDKKNVEKMVELIFSRQRLPGITGSFWYNDMKKLLDPQLMKSIEKKVLGSDKSLGAIFKILIDETTAFRGYSRSCAKFPVFVNHVPKLIQWYPECKVIHVIRDPRAIAMSRKNDPGGTQVKIKKYPKIGLFIRIVTIGSVMLQYVWASKLHLKYRKFQNYALFCYEDLLADPANTIKQLCEFADIDFVPEMLSPREGQASSITGKKQKGFDKQVATHWKTVISTVEEQLIVLFTKGSMKRFEYNPWTHPLLNEKRIS